MKKFSVPCFFNGAKSPFTIYLGAPEEGHHPLHFQSDWLSKERGGQIPAEIMDCIQKLKELAIKNNVSFEELCVYALDSAGTGEEEAAGASEMESTPEPANLEQFLEPPMFEEPVEYMGAETSAPVEESVSIEDLYNLHSHKELDIDMGSTETPNPEDYSIEAIEESFANESFTAPKTNQELPSFAPEEAAPMDTPIAESPAPKEMPSFMNQELPTDSSPEFNEPPKEVPPMSNELPNFDSLTEKDPFASNNEQDEESLLAGLQKAFEDLHIEDENKSNNADLFAGSEKDQDKKDS
jgi:hypothetical protein